MKQQILVDMDGVLADVYAQFISMEYANEETKPVQEDFNGKGEADLPSFRKHVKTTGFFRNAPLIANSVEGLKYLNDKYQVLIVSSATEFPDSLIEKQQWLNEHFPFISWKQMIFCGQKDSIKGDIMIDDHPKNLSTFDGKRIIFTQPHNVYIKDSTYQRVSGWDEIMRIL